MPIICTQGTYDLSITVQKSQIRHAASTQLHPHMPLIGRVSVEGTPHRQGLTTAEIECLLDVGLCNSRTHFRAKMCTLKCVRLITGLIRIFRWQCRGTQCCPHADTFRCVFITFNSIVIHFNTADKVFTSNRLRFHRMSTRKLRTPASRTCVVSFRSGLGLTHFFN